MNSTVMIVDDNDDLRELTALRLATAGIVSVQCADGAAALEALKHTRPGIILSDVKMPRLSGPDLLRQLREQGGDQLFIFFSGDMPRKQINDLVPYGVFEFLEKGTCDSLVDVVRSAQAFLKRAF